MSIERSLAASLRDFLGVFDIVATNKPAEIILTHSVAAKLGDRDGEIPRIAASFLSVVAGLQESIDGSRDRPWKMRIGVGKPANLAAGRLRIHFPVHPEVLRRAYVRTNINMPMVNVNPPSPN